MGSLRKTIDSMFSEPIAEALGGPPARVRAITDAERQARIREKQVDANGDNGDDSDVIGDVMGKVKQALQPGWDNGYDDPDMRDDALMHHAIQHTIQHMQHQNDVPTPDHPNVEIVKRNAKVKNGYRPTILEQAVRRLNGEM